MTDHHDWISSVTSLVERRPAQHDDRRAASRIAFGDLPTRDELSELFDFGDRLMEADDPALVLAGALLHRVVILLRDLDDVSGALPKRRHP